MATLKCRPSEVDNKDYREDAMIFMSAPQMLSLKLRNGDLCKLEFKDQAAVLAVAWITSKSELKEGLVGVSKWLQDQCGLKLGNDVLVTKAGETVQEVASISMKCLDDLDEERKQLWELTAAVTVSENYRYVAAGQVLDVLVVRKKKKFQVLGPRNTIYKAASITQVRIGEPQEDARERITFSRIGGLHAQKQRIRRLIRKTTSDQRSTKKHSLNAHATGVLLYGPGGTGKSSLRRALETEHDWSNISYWDSAGSKTPQLTTGSALVHINIYGKLSLPDAKAVEQLFRALPSTTMIVAEVRDPNDLQSFLRTENTFAHEIEVSIPDAQQRFEILTTLNDGLLSEDLLRDAAQKTHGYVGDDLSRLLNEIEDLVDEDSSQDREQPFTNGTGVHQNGSEATTNGTVQPPSTTQPLSTSHPTPTHLTLALTHIRPSALQSIILEKPHTPFSSIGGQTPHKTRLISAVTWPLKYPSELSRYGIPPKKGILLYGPPGCSKTMLVKALATESDYNFLAVKGAELISMYVGESERATREVFRKARAASPCIIFFDEIDAIAKRASGTSNSELNVLTTLLNEMDGFEELRDVLVVAATNKPGVIDPALMRPGRFDNVVYVGPPDGETREAIFRGRFSGTEKVCKEVVGRLGEFVRETEGMSGAEIVAACQMAGEIAFGESVDGVGNGEGGELREISADDVFEGIRRTPRAITRQMLAEYESWNAERAAS
ncbi:AAA+-type ATPase [Knufia obscura]|uniref:AAA+-type ATPase n=1 Tax=Knufia obscura TaxID=1635080 RepID=A0ABR0RE67_9EURO|nr:AAA+-type ATPase [Knufia obscura]